MSREVKIKDMPKEEDKTIFTESISKLVATVIGLLLMAVVGQGLLIWKNQDSIILDIQELKELESWQHKIKDRVLQLESHKTVAYGKLETLERTLTEAEKDKYQRGGSFRRNDAIAQQKELDIKISKNSGKIAAAEWKIDDLKDSFKELKNELIDSVNKIKLEHKLMLSSLSENSAEDNVRHASLQKAQNTISDALVSLNNEFEAFESRIDKIIARCEEEILMGED